MLKGLIRDRWIAILLLAGLTALLTLVLSDYGVGLPAFPTSKSRPETARPPVSSQMLESLIASPNIPRLVPSSPLENPFYTTHFQPQRPPPPTTRKVNMTYKGFIQSTDGERMAFVRLDDANVTARLGKPLIGDLSVSFIGTTNLTLTNTASQTNLLPFNKTQSVEVPAQ